MSATIKNIITFVASDNHTSLSVHLDTKAETVWLSLNQISELFERDKSVISRHLKKIFDERELDRDSTVAFFATVQDEGGHQVKRHIEYFNLDAILSVGYRVNSKRGTEFRRWSSQILKDYLLMGYAHNREYLLKSGLNDVSRSLDILKKSLLAHGYTDDIGHAAIDLIRSYSKSWLLLNAFDENRLTYNNKNIIYHENFTEDFCAANILSFKQDLMSQQEASELFGNQREHGLSQILGSIHQTFAGELLYQSIYERAAHLFYFTLKDHPFVDGNKRIGSFLLLLYLSGHHIQLDHITNEGLVALALLVAQSDPTDKDIIIKLVLNL
ncbi:MAG: virulence protein RhuM/Fic/DOC family protein [Candidatus Paracaedibacteraceae bacterium]|nr:virulence protein RhuM/Fic/DOC family protein [Candidatus Paracaedibacteraceae bacterium]